MTRKKSLLKNSLQWLNKALKLFRILRARWWLEVNEARALNLPIIATFSKWGWTASSFPSYSHGSGRRIGWNEVRREEVKKEREWRRESIERMRKNTSTWEGWRRWVTSVSNQRICEGRGWRIRSVWRIKSDCLSTFDIFSNNLFILFNYSFPFTLSIYFVWLLR